MLKWRQERKTICSLKERIRIKEVHIDRSNKEWLKKMQNGNEKKTYFESNLICLYMGYGVRKGRVEKSKRREGCDEKRKKNRKMKTQKTMMPSKVCSN